MTMYSELVGAATPFNELQPRTACDA